MPGNTAENAACYLQCSHAGAMDAMQSLLQKQHCQSLAAWRLRWYHIMSPLQAALGHVKAFPAKLVVRLLRHLNDMYVADRHCIYATFIVG